MDQPENILDQLKDQLEKLNNKNEEIHSELNRLRKTIETLQRNQILDQEQPDLKEDVQKVPSPQPLASVPEPPATSPLPSFRIAAESETEPEPEQPAWKANIEKFIGENLISKIGIAITLIGVGIGTKFTIDHDLISPLIRIILGYLLGIAMSGIALKLKRNYLNFSAVLLAGGMAVIYLVTLAAWSYFGLIPRVAAFVVMAGMTVLTVGAALLYNRQIIAHFGLVGAYAVPFLLDDGSGNAVMLFSYMAVINAGILWISVLRYWKPIHYTSFAFTWLVVFQWLIGAGKDESFVFPMGFFLVLFYGLFYLVLILYQLRNKQQSAIGDILMLFTDSALFYGFGYVWITLNNGDAWLGLFTLLVAASHAAIFTWLHFGRSVDTVLKYFIAGLCLTFVTLAVPVEFDGQWVTIFWLAESVLLFYGGRIRKIPMSEAMSYALILLSFFSLAGNWMDGYLFPAVGTEKIFVIPLLNVKFLVSLSAVVVLALMTRWYFTVEPPVAFPSAVMSLTRVMLPAMLMMVTFLSLFFEIHGYAGYLYATSVTVRNGYEGVPFVVANELIPRMSIIAKLAYTLIFFSGLMWMNRKIFRSQELGLISIILNILALSLALSFGLPVLSGLLEMYVDPDTTVYYRGAGLVLVRYPLIILVALVLFSLFKEIYQGRQSIDFKSEFDLVLHLVILVLLSSELIQWLRIGHCPDVYKIWLSILFGVYSVGMIIIGIVWKKKHLRVAAMVLFGTALIKLLIYDLANLDTISKTIVFLSLGILLLIMAWLYTRYTARIFGEH
jgi:uncharacterized membrane protein